MVDIEEGRRRCVIDRESGVSSGHSTTIEAGGGAGAGFNDTVFRRVGGTVGYGVGTRNYGYRAGVCSRWGWSR